MAEKTPTHQTPPSDAEAHDADESYPIRFKEIALFLVFGIIPISVLYGFATQGIEDERGESFEQERRVMMAECLEQLDDREMCHEIVDEPLIDCYKRFAGADGAVADRDGLRDCVTGRTDGKYRPADMK